MERNILLTIAYDGARFHGWQKQPEDVTVQGYLEQTFSRLFGRQIRLNGTSRTDAGVHALGQRASFRADIGIPEDRLARVMNNALCGREEGSFAVSPVRILQARDVPLDFHARFDSRGKKYIYRISAAPEPDVFRRNYVYFPAQRLAEARDLNPEAMQAAADQLIGTHDFKSFEAAGSTPRESTVRTIYDARVYRAGAMSNSATPAGAIRADATPTGPAAGADPAKAQTAGSVRLNPAKRSPARHLHPQEDEILFEVSGDGFLYNMVRILTGTLVEVGLGRRSPDEMRQIIEAKDRREAGHTAPPYGLYLAEVYYDQPDGRSQTQLG